MAKGEERFSRLDLARLHLERVLKLFRSHALMIVWGPHPLVSGG
jgi:hypothetical protein